MATVTTGRRLSPALWILGGEGQRNFAVYRGLVELLSRFGYLSIREAMYGFNLSLQSAIDRLRYLEKSEIVQRFPSGTVPTHFYCLTAKGRRAALDFQIADHISAFTPSQYNLIFQQHSRDVARSFLALRHICGERLADWVSEELLKHEMGALSTSRYSAETRVFDGLFYLNAEVRSYRRNSSGYEETGERRNEMWRCGFELELSLKSPARYAKQFEILSRQTWDPLNQKQLLPMVLFLFRGPAIGERLASHLETVKDRMGQCVVYLGEAAEFFEKLGEARVVKIVRGEKAIIPAAQMSVVKEAVR